MERTQEWDQRWLDLATSIGLWSKDRVHKVGCVIVGEANQILSTGYNGFPRGVDDDIDARHERPAKYDFTEHAERNAIFNATRFGAVLLGSDVYSSLFPCIACSRAIIQIGAKTVITHTPNMDHPRWGREFEFSIEMLAEVGIGIRMVD